jgi:RNA polymerase sigma-70 factor (ECF subfamily)
MTSDESLMLQFQGGSREAFEELYVRHRGPLYGFFRRRVENDGRAEELAQETFLAVIRGAARYEPRASVRSYLYGIASKLIASERRKHHDLPLEEGMADLGGSNPDDVVWIRQGLLRLEDSEREILMLREYEQLSYEDIAQVLRLPLNTVRSRLFRARMTLKSALDPQARAEGGMRTGAGRSASSGSE